MTRPTTRRVVAWFAALVCTAGCYPIHKTLQPRATATVVDAVTHAPIVNAPVVLISGAYPYGSERSRDVVATDSHGVAAFQGRHEWRWETLMIHGYEIYFWNWCVEWPGYETVLTGWRNSDDFVADYRVDLKAGVSTPCPAAPSP